MTTFDIQSSPVTPVVGYGALGREIVTQLLAAGRSVRVIQRSRPKDLPSHAEFVSADIMDRAAITAATAGAEAIVFALGLPYFADLWEKGWPLAMQSILAACEAHGSRLPTTSISTAHRMVRCRRICRRSIMGASRRLEPK